MNDDRRMFTPNDINLVLHVYAIAEPIRQYAPHYREGRLVHLEGMGLIVYNDRSPSGWSITEMGTALVNKWCSQPLPRMKWVFD